MLGAPEQFGPAMEEQLKKNSLRGTKEEDRKKDKGRRKDKGVPIRK